MKGVYLFACKARHKNYNLDYNDIVPIYNCDLICDAMQVDLSNYDFIIASPPCNYWSKANPYYRTSKYSLETSQPPKTLIKLPYTVSKGTITIQASILGPAR